MPTAGKNNTDIHRALHHRSAHSRRSGNARPVPVIVSRQGIRLAMQGQILQGRHHRLVLAHHIAGDDHPLDLAGAFVNAQQANIAQQLFTGYILV
jgi:hypothetical protein